MYLQLKCQTDVFLAQALLSNNTEPLKCYFASPSMLASGIKIDKIVNRPFLVVIVVGHIKEEGKRLILNFRRKMINR